MRPGQPASAHAASYERRKNRTGRPWRWNTHGMICFVARSTSSVAARWASWTARSSGRLPNGNVSPSRFLVVPGTHRRRQIPADSLELLTLEEPLARVVLAQHLDVRRGQQLPRPNGQPEGSAAARPSSAWWSGRFPRGASPPGSTESTRQQTTVENSRDGFTLFFAAIAAVGAYGAFKAGQRRAQAAEQQVAILRAQIDEARADVVGLAW